MIRQNTLERSSYKNSSWLLRLDEKRNIIFSNVLIFQQRKIIWDLSQRPTLKPNDPIQCPIYVFDINGKQSFYYLNIYLVTLNFTYVHLAPRARIHRIKLLFVYLLITLKLQTKYSKFSSHTYIIHDTKTKRWIR